MTVRPRKNLQGLHRYPLPTYDRRNMLRLDMNENVGVLPIDLFREALASVDNDVLQSYPQYGELYRKLAAHLALPESHLLLTNGSDSAAKLIFDTFVDAGEGVVMSNPSFAMHRVYATIVEGRIEACDFGPDLAFPIADMVERIDVDTKLAIVVSPNNPTGALVPEASLRQLIEKCRSVGALVYVDEAYVEYCGKSLVSWVTRYDNLVVSRTFSKAAGLPSARLGVLIGQPGLLELLRLTQPIYDVNQYAVILGETLLDNHHLVDAYVAEVKAGADWLRRAFADLEVPCHVGQANFALFQPGCDVKKLTAQFRESGILVSSGFTLPCLADWMRIAIGPPAVMEIFINRYRELCRWVDG